MRALTLLLVALQGLAASTTIPVDREPRHRILYADAQLRVLEVAVPPNDTTLAHLHTHDLATVNIENGPTRTRDAGQDWGTVRARTVGGVNVTEYTLAPMAHEVQTVGDKAYRLTGVENLKDGGWSALPAIAGSGLTVAAESRAFRAYDLRLGPSAASTHTHQVPVAIVVVDGTIDAGGRVLSTSGQWSLVPAGATHTVTARGIDAHAVEIEVR
jgi:hypothetical protein